MAPDVFQALERECGLLLEGKEYIPERPVTATYERVTLEEVIEAIIRLADLPNTMLATVSSGAVKLAVLATGRKAPTKAVTRWRRQAPKVSEPEALMELYQKGKYREAMPVAKEALKLAEQTFGPDNPYVATSLTNLAELYRIQGQYAQAEPLHKRALAIREKALGPDHPLVATSLNNLADLYRAQGQAAQAEPLYKRSPANKEALRRLFLALPEQNRQLLLEQVKRVLSEERAAELIQSLVE
ncbi:MAG: tetratricopeptide repeat protein [Nitrospinae bacterium]|nr:tetratricopeptide repeat protein [Nitrospinota bacterium]